MLRSNHGVSDRMVNIEARRRIEAADLKDHDQRNILRRADAAEIAAMNATLDRILEAARRLKGSSPIPHDFRHDRHWE